MADSTPQPLLVRNGYVVPGAHRSHLDRADILIDGSRIAAIGPDLVSDEAVARRHPLVIDAAKRIVIPGFINAHTHSNESFCQGFWDALPLEVWILHEYPPFAVKPLPERAHYLRTMLLAVECLRSGITTVQDDLINRLAEPAAFDGCAAAYRDIGLPRSPPRCRTDRSSRRCRGSTSSWIPPSRRSSRPCRFPRPKTSSRCSRATRPAGTTPATDESAPFSDP